MIPNNPYKYAHRLGNPQIVLEALKQRSFVSPHKSADFLRRLNLIFGDQEYRELFFDSVNAETLISWFQNPPISNKLFKMLRELQLLPTPEILAVVERSGGEGLEKEIDKIEKNGFDVDNDLHMELEYSKFKTGRNDLIDKKRSTNFQSFKKISQLKKGQIDISGYTYHKAELTANEALTVFDVIKEKAEGDVPVLVIANMRYGSYFVVSPIEELLTREGVMIFHEYIPSIYFDWENDKPHCLSQIVWDIVGQHHPHIFVVDGTMATTTDDEENSRFPAAMWGYINEFFKYNAACGIPSPRGSVEARHIKYFEHFDPVHPYKVKFWSPQLTEKKFVGKWEYNYSQTGEETRDLILMCANGNGIEYSNACFDDPEKSAQIEGSRLCFTSSGLGLTPAPSEEEFVKEIQRLMKQKVSEIL